MDPELGKRIEDFNKELQVLLDKHSFNMASEAIILDGKIVTKVVVVPKEVEEVKKDVKGKSKK